MKWMLMLALVAACSSKVQEPKKPEVKKEMSPIQDATYYDLEGNYSLTSNGCDVRWGIIREKKTVKKNIILKLFSIDLTTCKESFEALLPTHKLVLEKLFADFPADTVHGVSTGGLVTINPDHNWNLAVAKASLGFKAKPSVNKEFVKIANTANPQKPFTDLLQSFGLSVKLSSVEKVFIQTVSETKFKDQFLPQVQKKQILTDAGALWWK